jgi:DNA-binding NarL/FixJ family response regulator
MNMPGGGINAVAKIAHHCPSTKTLMLTVVDDEDEVRSALRKGARGYLLKGATSSELVDAVRLLNKGQSYISPIFAARLIMSRAGNSNVAEAPKHFPELTEREEQILRLILRGLSNRLIGDELSLSEKTVKGYVTSVMEKLQVRNRVEAAMLAAERLADKPSSS